MPELLTVDDELGVALPDSVGLLLRVSLELCVPDRLGEADRLGVPLGEGLFEVLGVGAPLLVLEPLNVPVPVSLAR